MSNQPEQPQPAPPGYNPPGYMSAPTPPPAYMPPPAPYGQPPLPQAGPYAQPQNPYGQPQYAAPTHYTGGPGYIDATSGKNGMSLASMIIGLASLFVVGWFMVPQIVGIVLGHIGLSKESPQGKPFSITGLITNYLALLIYGAIWAFVFVGLSMLGYDSTSGYEELSAALSPAAAR